MDHFTLMRAKRLIEQALAGINVAIRADKNGDAVMFGEGIHDAEHCSHQVSAMIVAWSQKMQKEILRTHPHHGRPKNNRQSDEK